MDMGKNTSKPTYPPGAVTFCRHQFVDVFEVLLEGPHPFPPHLELELGKPIFGKSQGGMKGSVGASKIHQTIIGS